MEVPKRKPVRLKNYDYSTPGYYFVTICTRNKQKLFCDIVGAGVLDGPQIQHTEIGQIIAKRLETMSRFYDDVVIDKWVMMPNHIHLLVHILDCGNGPSRTPAPTNSKLAQFIGTFKRFCNEPFGHNVWQRSYHDHIIRGEKDYLKIWEYIDTNPAKWAEDCFYAE